MKKKGKQKKTKKYKTKKSQTPSKIIQLNKSSNENEIYPINNEEIEKVTKEIENEVDIFHYKPKSIKEPIKEFDEDKYVNKKYNPYAINGFLNNKNNPMLKHTSSNNIDIQINPDYIDNKEFLSKDELLISKFKENKENILENKVEGNNLGYINKNFLLLIDKKSIDDNNNNFYYYKHLIYGDKKFYLMTKGKYIIKNKELNYYCNNNNTTKKSIDGTKHSICKCIIKYNKIDGNYYIINGHSEECLSIRKQKYENSADINKEIANYNDYKILLTSKLQKDPLVTFNEFKKWASELYRNSEYNFELKVNTIKNIYYQWKKNSLLFTKYTLLENNKTFDNKIFLRDYSNCYLYDNSGKKLYNHEHMIFMSPFQVNKIINSPHLYFDGTFVFPPGFMQMLIILYYDNEINKRAPGAYILLNNKKEKSYIQVLRQFKSIISLENTIKLKLISYTSDYEISLCNALERIFPNIRHVGCYYHYCDNIVDNIKNKIPLTVSHSPIE